MQDKCAEKRKITGLLSTQMHHLHQDRARTQRCKDIAISEGANFTSVYSSGLKQTTFSCMCNQSNKAKIIQYVL